MPRRSLLTSALLALMLAGCKHPADDPQAQCYSGIVLGYDCYDGVLINVDGPRSIGKPVPYGFALYDATGATNQNVIGALNSTELASLNVPGQRIYFSCTGDTQGFSDFGPCNAMGIAMPIPHVVLTSFSATPCSATKTK